MIPKINSKKFAQLHQKILDFNTIRGWNPSAQNIAKSVVIEAAELLEHFQWDNGNKDETQERDLVEIGYEISDVIWYLFLLCNKLGINLTEAMEHKLKHNEKKYPAKKFVNGHNEEFYRSQKKKYRQQGK